MERDFDKSPFIIFWETTRACNLVCSHCRAEAKPTPAPNELSTKEVQKLIEEISQFETKPILVLTGGDPLMRDDIFDLIEYSNSFGIRTAVTPAPTPLMTRENIEKLKESGADRIALSLDGSTKTRHNKLRGVSKSFDAILDAASYAEEVDLPIQINTTITKETVTDLKAIAELTEQLDAVLWSLFFLVPVGRGEKLEMITSEEAERIMEFLYREEQKRPYQVKTTEATHYRRVVLQNSGTPLSKDPQKRDKIGRSVGVSDGNGIVFVSRTGEIYPSGFLPLKAGSVLEEGLIKTYKESKLFKELRDKSLLKGKCGVCEYNSICGGSRARAYSIYGDHLAPDPLCAYYPEEWDEDSWDVYNSN
ncbi:hypothetical protein AKJ57_03740 [candidate division MSBL1 archaeon SCGC-AAA259A05]|uniref:Radical SAM core domain-containing protein n=1 Tax=candidate division MSBL1 archaeon SCGC-AAA259A05 TaxID=1698259 RepID=A0A133U9C3_9EURY|nr:hypothetical protein AKJ57_03740 [candidate division MSBL1 archaeon SCGC-AAA259A05]